MNFFRIERAYAYVQENKWFQMLWVVLSNTYLSFMSLVMKVIKPFDDIAAFTF